MRARRHLAYVIDALIVGALLAAALAVYSALFLHVPILTEARDFLFHRGWGATPLQMWVPSGSDVRPLSWYFFAWQRDMFGLSNAAANLVQFALLGLCAGVGYAHLRQLAVPRVHAVATAAVWLVSLPALHAAFWQATQHDKFGFLFTMLAVMLSLHSIRVRTLRAGLLLSVATTLVAIAAVASKPVAFSLVGIFALQALLFCPQHTRAAAVRSLVVVAAPCASVTLYALVYASRMTDAWRAHTTQGDVANNLLIYMRYATNADYDSNVWPSLVMFAPVAAGWIWAWWRVAADWQKSSRSAAGAPARSSSDARTLAYLGATFGGCVVLLARANHPASFYMLIPGFAFLASVIMVATRAPEHWPAILRRATPPLAVAVFLAIVTINTTRDSHLGRLRHGASNLAAGYEQLRSAVQVDELQAIAFVVNPEPGAYFYFFSDGPHTGIDPTIPSFIFNRELDIPIRHYAERPRRPKPGELVAVFSDDLRLLEASFSAKTLLRSPALTAAQYRVGHTLSFVKGGDGVQFLQDGWSRPETHGTWNDGTEAIIALPLDREYNAPVAMSIWARPYLAPEEPLQRVQLYVGEDAIAEWLLDDIQDAEPVSAIIPATHTTSAHLTLRLRFPDASAPAAHGKSADGRRLALAIRRLSTTLHEQQP